MTDNSSRKFLIFFVGGERYAFDLAQVAEVMEPVISWPIPLAPPCYIGAINFHGSIVAVMDLAIFLGYAATTESEKIIVLDPNLASLSFFVERVAKIVKEEEILFNETDVRLASATLRLPEGDAILLDIDAIIRGAEIEINR